MNKIICLDVTFLNIIFKFMLIVEFHSDEIGLFIFNVYNKILTESWLSSFHLSKGKNNIYCLVFDA